MALHPADIDRLVEEGLLRYGKGDLDGALEAWERALAVDPRHSQATSYIDYVRLNYELLVDGSAPKQHVDGAFGIGGDEPDYQVEIVPGEIAPSIAVRISADAIDDGWAFDDEPLGGPPTARTATVDPPQVTLELEADEPPEGGMGFDDATREYVAGRPVTRDLALASELAAMEFPPQLTPAFGAPADVNTPEFGSAQDLNTPTNFGQEATNVRKRDFGFLRPSSRAEPAIEMPRARRASVVPPELRMTLRTPELPLESGTADITLDRGTEELDLEHEAPTVATRSIEAKPIDLIGSLPSPKPGLSINAAIAAAMPSAPGGDDDDEPAITITGGEEVAEGDDDLEGATVSTASAESPEREASLFGSDVETRDLPAAAMLSIAAEHNGTKANTRELPQPERRPASPSEPPTISTQATLDLGLDLFAPPLGAQPTRDLGLRPPTSSPRPQRALSPEDEPTAEIEIHKLAAQRARTDVEIPTIAPFDQRNASILEDIDAGAPADELRDDLTRRRIQSLLEHAAEWIRNEPDRAVAAVELALCEDSTSPLAQKLVHRNREAIMALFQTYLGNLQRQPVLAIGLNELASAPISSRAAFLVSRIDGVLSLDEILDVSGMPRLEAYRYLCQLFLRGILR